MEQCMLKIDNVSKQYKLGQIGGTSLREELQRRRARRRGEEDPTRKIGAKEYKTGETFMALDGVSFEVKKGERVGIIGHNGAGKSTLLKLISRVTAPTAGQICMNGRVASMLEVGTGFHGELTGRENIYMNGAILGMTRKEIDAKLEDIIEFSECRQFIDTPVKRYSSGMYVKLAFSVAAHLDSEIMIMDEVLAVGDMAFQKKCLDKMSDVSKTQGRTILYVSHNMNTIRQLCERVIVLDHGKVVFDGGVEEGIGVYMGNSKDNETVFDYGKRESAQGTSGEVQILSSEILGESNTFFMNDAITLKIKFRLVTPIDCFRLRIIVSEKDRAVATSHSGVIFCRENNKIMEETFKLCIAGLVPGSYILRYIVFQDGSFGKQHRIDDIINAASFIIKETYSYSGMEWQKNYWGYSELPELIQL